MTMREYRLLRALGVAALLACTTLAAPHAQSKSSAANTSAMTPELKAVKQALDKYQDPIAAVHDGYFSTLACVEYPDGGAAGEVPYPKGGMGVHFFNGQLMGPKIDPMRPQVLVYEPVGDKLRLVAAEWFVPVEVMKERPTLFGQQFDGPMEGHHPVMPLELHHYDLHVWLWKPNPSGLFAPTNPDMKCPAGTYTVQEKAPKIVKVGS